MTVKEYAESVSLSVAEILKKCESLGIDVKNADDVLSDDDVINLDFATNLISTDSESTYEEEDSMDEVVEDLVLSTNIHTMNPETKKQKLKKRSEIESSKSEYFNKRKEIYKHCFRRAVKRKVRHWRRARHTAYRYDFGFFRTPI